MKPVSIYLFVIVILLCVVVFARLLSTEYFGIASINPPKSQVRNDLKRQQEPDRHLYLSRPSKCFDCETDLLERGENPALGQQSKSFDSESEMARRMGMGNIVFGQATKCFDCEKQMMGMRHQELLNQQESLS